MPPTTKRKPIGKRTRFEIFERDKFTCQYCGRMPPEVMLEVDHIIPVSKHGTNDPENLRTSCFDCNRGKLTKEIGQSLNPADSAKRSQEAMETIHSAKMFSKASKARARKRQEICNEISKITEKDTTLNSNITSFSLAVEKFGIEKAFHFLDRAACTMGRGFAPSEDNLFRYFNGCVKRAIEQRGE